ncbi:hypothetical protein ACJO1H_03355 [Vibrio parahaemolyticus]|uniref:hypothetical protein n=1 Tax=Vibrio parahaemolyticus TaxID=670 RepID=UPI001D954A2B|nr:hypothetical protein [Vibrio parahaemolyticus]EGR0557206.1 hypothetical protein [Vibrio cholerae]HDY8202815.1 hypothetical protein [Vibrio vulnificus]EGR4287012.1 hypothetical protein [Vibrio cholerae]ELJ8482285.1 hypothetical protein [Vibrio cholerae]MEA5326938.1 hypothetical protein [Vibrio parahaemolyticus]
MNPSHVKVAIDFLKEKNQASLFDLHNKFRLTYTESVNAISYLNDQNIVSFDGYNFSLNDDVSIENISNLYNAIRFRSFSLEHEIIEGYKESALGISDLYMPNLNRIDGSLLVDS